jgi:hypothetical protein
VARTEQVGDVAYRAIRQTAQCLRSDFEYPPSFELDRLDGLSFESLVLGSVLSQLKNLLKPEILQLTHQIFPLSCL